MHNVERPILVVAQLGASENTPNVAHSSSSGGAQEKWKTGWMKFIMVVMYSTSPETTISFPNLLPHLFPE